jgi:acyl dehydratase
LDVPLPAATADKTLPPLSKEKNRTGRSENTMTTPQGITKPFYFEDFHLGQRFVTNARTVTEADVVNFAGLSWDHNPLHTDEVYSSKTGYGKRIAHSLGCYYPFRPRYLLTEDPSGFSRFHVAIKLPIYIGDTIHVEQVVEELRDSARRSGYMTFEKESLISEMKWSNRTTTILLAKGRLGLPTDPASIYLLPFLFILTI